MRWCILLCLVGCNNTQQCINVFDDKKIEIIAPGSSCTFNVNIKNNIQFLQKSFDDDEKLFTIKNALLNSDIDIIWALRGGYGTSNIVNMMYQDKDFLKKLHMKKHYPWVIGYSDITALHLFLAQELKWQTIHGPVFREINSTTESIKYHLLLKKIINHKVSKIIIHNLVPLNVAAKQTQTIIGKLIGGNLSILQTSIGTIWQINADNKILFIEDCNETANKIVRMLNHLKMTKILDNANAIIIGYMHHIEGDKNLIIEFVKKIQTPVYFLSIFGHGMQMNNFPIIYNANAKISLEEDNISLTQFLKQ